MSTRNNASLPASDDEQGWEEYSRQHPFYVPGHPATRDDFTASDLEVVEAQITGELEEHPGHVKDLVFALGGLLTLILLLLYFHPWG